MIGCSQLSSTRENAKALSLQFGREIIANIQFNKNWEKHSVEVIVYKNNADPKGDPIIGILYDSYWKFPSDHLIAQLMLLCG